MRTKRFTACLMACVLAFGLLTTVGTASTQEARTVDMRALTCESLNTVNLEHFDIQTAARAYHNFNANSGVTVDNSFTLNVGNTITYNCTYTPTSASVDFGFIAPDGLFYFVNSTTGSISTTIQVSQRGSYTLAICNNSDRTVTVTGTVSY